MRHVLVFLLLGCGAKKAQTASASNLTSGYVVHYCAADQYREMRASTPDDAWIEGSCKALPADCTSAADVCVCLSGLHDCAWEMCTTQDEVEYGCSPREEPVAQAVAISQPCWTLPTTHDDPKDTGDHDASLGDACDFQAGSCSTYVCTATQLGVKGTCSQDCMSDSDCSEDGTFVCSQSYCIVATAQWCQ